MSEITAELMTDKLPNPYPDGIRTAWLVRVDGAPVAVHGYVTQEAAIEAERERFLARPSNLRDSAPV